MAWSVEVVCETCVRWYLLIMRGAAIYVLNFEITIYKHMNV